jgi:Helix-turn-helix domain
LSIKWSQYVWAESPYSGPAFTVHLALADYANDSGECYPFQESLATKARVSLSSVEKAIKQMCDDGYLEKFKRGHQHRYRLLVSNSGPVPQTGGPVTGTGGPVTGTGGPVTGTGGPVTGTGGPVTGTGSNRTVSEPPKNLRTPDPSGPARNEDPVRASYGDGEELPEAGAKPKKVPFDKAPTEGTHGWLVQRFEQERQRAAVGSHRYNRGHLNRLLRTLRDDDGMSNKEIEVLIRTFFVRHGQTLRVKTREIDLVSLFAQMIPQLQQQAKEQTENVRTGRVSAMDRAMAESAERKKRLG